MCSAIVLCAAALACTAEVAPSERAGTGSNGGTNPPGAQATDPGRVSIHRLNNYEYNNTTRDLLGTSSTPAANFLAEEADGFDNIATALGMTSAQYEGYFNAATALAEEVFASDALRANLLSCTPAVASDPCALSIIEDFGRRAFRRPLTQEEITRTLAQYDGELARSSDALLAMKHTLRALLASASFLYRFEFDADPASLTPRALNGYELASRLSYLTWSTMPDAELFRLAESGELTDPAVIEAQVDRMLADAKAKSFTESFAGQWLDLRDLIGHGVAPEVFPSWSEPLKNAMMIEGYLWFHEFLLQDRSMSEWFTADFHYVNDTLAAHYGFPSPGTGEGFARVEVTSDERRGFLGLAGFLTRTSFPSRTSPTLRAVWVLSNMLCDEPPPPPPVAIPDLEASATEDEAAGVENVRERLALHRKDPACAGCHNTLDPIGLAFEHYDGIGVYRTHYGNGDPVDATGTLPDGTAITGLPQMADLLTTDPRFGRCVTEKLLTYALGRSLTETDEPYVEQIQEGWDSRGLTLRNLLKEVVMNDTFRFRRGEAP